MTTCTMGCCCGSAHDPGEACPVGAFEDEPVEAPLLPVGVPEEEEEPLVEVWLFVMPVLAVGLAALLAEEDEVAVGADALGVPCELPGLLRLEGSQAAVPSVIMTKRNTTSKRELRNLVVFISAAPSDIWAAVA